MPRRSPPATIGPSRGTPGLLTTSSMPSRREMSPPLRGPRPAETPPPPRRSSAAAAAFPERASPSTSAFDGNPFTAPRGCLTPCRSARPWHVQAKSQFRYEGVALSRGCLTPEEVLAESGEVPVVQREADRAQDPRHDPEAHHDLGLGPGFHLEVVLNRCHQEDPPPEVLEREDLDDHGERRNHEDAADQEKERDRLREDREARERAADRHRPGVAHEHLRRPSVVPEEPDRGSDQRGRDNREIELGLEPVPRPARPDPSDDVHRREGKQRDDPSAGGEPVNAVGQVDAVRGSGDYKKQQPVPRVRQLQRSDTRDVDLSRQVLVARGKANADRDRAQQEQLPAAVQPERALVRQLDHVVEEPDRAAPERDEEHRERRHGVAAEREEADAGGEQNQEPAHRRRPLLGDVVFWPLLSDLLAVLLAPEVGDELRADEDRNQERDDACDQDSAQARTVASASATTSRPTAREPLTSTQSPGSTTSSATAIAAGAVARRGGLVANLNVKGDRPRAELCHVPEVRDPPPVSRALDEIGERRAHRDRVGVVRVVDQHTAARERELLASPARELDVHSLRPRQPQRVERG